MRAQFSPRVFDLVSRPSCCASDMLLLKLLEFLYCDVPVSSTIGSLSSDDGDGNENGKKAIGLYQQNNNFARDHAFVYSY